MATPVKRKWKHYRKDDWVYTVTFEQPAGTAKDLTGYTVVTETDPDVVVEESTPGTTGVVQLRIDRNDIAALAAAVTAVAIDFALIDPSDNRQTYVVGTIVLVEPVP